MSVVAPVSHRQVSASERELLRDVHYELITTNNKLNDLLADAKRQQEQSGHMD